MIIVLSGPWGVGKSETISQLRDNYGFHTVIPWTTKNIANSLHGTKYNVLLSHKKNGAFEPYDEKELLDFNESFYCPFNFLEEQTANENSVSGFWSQPFHNVNNYQVNGYKLGEIIDISNLSSVVIEADTSVAMQLKNAAQNGAIGRVITIFLDYESNGAFTNKLNIDELLTDSLRHEKRQHKAKECEFYIKYAENYFDYHICSDSSKGISKKVVDIARTFVQDNPNMIHKRPGALGYQDIKMAMDAGEIRIHIEKGLEKEVNDYLGSCLFEKGQLTQQAVVSSAVDLLLAPVCQIENKQDVDCIDLVLGNNATMLDMLKENNMRPINASSEDLEHLCRIAKDSREKTFREIFTQHPISMNDGLIINPHETVMCSSLEKIYVGSNIIAFITSKCSFSQLGISISLSQNILQPNHYGEVLLQIKNNLSYPIVIYPYMRIAQIVFFRTISDDKQNMNSTRPNQAVKRYYDGEGFATLSKEIIKSKNWNAFMHHSSKTVSQADNNESKRIMLQARTTRIAIAAAIISALSFIGTLVFSIINILSP